MTPLPRSISEIASAGTRCRRRRAKKPLRTASASERGAGAVHRRFHLAENPAARNGDEEPGGPAEVAGEGAHSPEPIFPSARKFPQQR